jgi:hypothetical protein
MSNKESFHQPPVADGIEHGPYPHDGTEYSQTNGLHAANETALAAGRLTTGQYGEAIERLTTVAAGEHNDAMAKEEAEHYARLGEETDVDEAGSWDKERTDNEDEEPENGDVDEMMRDIDHGDEDESDPWDYEEEDNEDPLEGDVDHWVDPRETRTDEEVARDSQYEIEPYGVDGDDR